jgi:hypothetical protein
MMYYCVYCNEEIDIDVYFCSGQCRIKFIRQVVSLDKKYGTYEFLSSRRTMAAVAIRELSSYKAHFATVHSVDTHPVDIY